MNAYRRLMWIVGVCLAVLVAGCSSTQQVVQNQITSPDEALQSYFNASLTKDYQTAVKLYGGSYEMLEGYNPDIDPHDRAALFQRYMEMNGGVPVKIDKILNKKRVSNDEYVYEVVFKTEDDKPFRNGLHYTYTAKRIEGQWKVIELPPYLA